MCTWLQCVWMLQYIYIFPHSVLLPLYPHPLNPRLWGYVARHYPHMIHSFVKETNFHVVLISCIVLQLSHSLPVSSFWWVLVHFFNSTVNVSGFLDGFQNLVVNDANLSCQWLFLCLESQILLCGLTCKKWQIMSLSRGNMVYGFQLVSELLWTVWNRLSLRAQGCQDPTRQQKLRQL